MQVKTLSNALAAVLASEPGLRISNNERHIIVGFWFETAVGRKYACACEPTFSLAYARAVTERETEIAAAKIEAEVRAEVAARMARAA